MFQFTDLMKILMLLMKLRFFKNSVKKIKNPQVGVPTSTCVVISIYFPSMDHVLTVYFLGFPSPLRALWKQAFMLENLTWHEHPVAVKS